MRQWEEQVEKLSYTMWRTAEQANISEAMAQKLVTEGLARRRGTADGIKYLRQPRWGVYE